MYVSTGAGALSGACSCFGCSCWAGFYFFSFFFFFLPSPSCLGASGWFPPKSAKAASSSSCSLFFFSFLESFFSSTVPAEGFSSWVSGSGCYCCYSSCSDSESSSLTAKGLSIALSSNFFFTSFSGLNPPLTVLIFPLVLILLGSKGVILGSLFSLVSGWASL